MLRKVATSLHNRMNGSGVAAPSVDVIVYALDIATNTLAIIVLSLIAGLITGEAGETALTLIVFAFIRYLSGGYHLKSGVYCIILSTVLVSLMPHIHLTPAWTYALNGLALGLFMIFAPANLDKHARISPKHYPLLKVVSSMIVALNFWIAYDLLAVIFFVQAISLPFRERR